MKPSASSPAPREDQDSGWEFGAMHICHGSVCTGRVCTGHSTGPSDFSRSGVELSAVFSPALSDPAQEKNLQQRWLFSVYVAKLLNILSCLVQKTVVIVFKQISCILEHSKCALNMLRLLLYGFFFPSLFQIQFAENGDSLPI